MMDIGDVFEKYYMIFTVIPTLYWLESVNVKTFSLFNMSNISLYIGIFLISCFMFFKLDYTHNFANKDVKSIFLLKIHPSAQFPFLIKLFYVCLWLYSGITFYYLITNPFDTVILGLFAFYAIVIVFIVLILILGIYLTLTSDFLKSTLKLYREKIEKELLGKE